MDILKESYKWVGHRVDQYAVSFKKSVLSEFERWCLEYDGLG
jgi:hypothetical protein